MCGRYAATDEIEDLVREFEIAADLLSQPARSILKNPQEPPPATPDFNMAPTKQAPVVLTRRPPGEAQADPLRQLRLLTWGLVPSWSTDTKGAARLTNARAESVLDKRAFAKPALTRRCLVPARAWYEWEIRRDELDAKGKPVKQPHAIRRRDEEPLALAGLYEFWRDPAGAEDDPLAWLTTYTIITTAADPDLAWLHDRQPLVLEPEDWERWLDPDRQDRDEVERLLAFALPGRFETYPVSRAVNSVTGSGPDLLAPLNPA